MTNTLENYPNISKYLWELWKDHYINSDLELEGTWIHVTNNQRSTVNELAILYYCISELEGTGYKIIVSKPDIKGYEGKDYTLILVSLESLSPSQLQWLETYLSYEYKPYDLVNNSPLSEGIQEFIEEVYEDRQDRLYKQFVLLIESNNQVIFDLMDTINNENIKSILWDCHHNREFPTLRAKILPELYSELVKEGFMLIDIDDRYLSIPTLNINLSI